LTEPLRSVETLSASYRRKPCNKLQGAITNIQKGKKMKWKNIRIPEELHKKLSEMCKHFDKCQELAIMDVPSEFADRGGTPYWYVIEKTIHEYEEHRKRSRRTKRVYMDNAETTQTI